MRWLKIFQTRKRQKKKTGGFRLSKLKKNLLSQRDTKEENRVKKRWQMLTRDNQQEVMTWYVPGSLLYCLAQKTQLKKSSRGKSMGLPVESWLASW